MSAAGGSKKRGGRPAEWPRPSPAAMASGTLGYWAERYVTFLRERNYSERTLEQRQGYLANFAAWCEARSLMRPEEITRAIVERYQSSLYYHRQKGGRPLSFQAQSMRLVSIEMYFKWLARQRVISLSPASVLELPRLRKQLPRTVLTALEVEAVLRVPDVGDVLGLRDRAMMETLYATAIRRAELVGLDLYDLDRDRQTLMIREGKGRRDRVVPLGERALLWVDKYLADSRPHLVAAIDDAALFLSVTGERLSLDHVSILVRQHVDRAELGKRGACHLFRHTAATLMLENGADIRLIQQLLGHAKLDTTAIYTQVSITKLKEVHALTHPGARLAPPPPATEPAAPAAGAARQATSPADAAGAASPATSPVDAAAQLQALLDDDQADDEEQRGEDEDGG